MTVPPPGPTCERVDVYSTAAPGLRRIDHEAEQKRENWSTEEALIASPPLSVWYLKEGTAQDRDDSGLMADFIIIMITNVTRLSKIIANDNVFREHERCARRWDFGLRGVSRPSPRPEATERISRSIKF
ncbi:uncharacterized protein LOC117218766 isoform X8 [Megalopta genalis]|uniref:uncharacterized protein LOC117218766 isoform X8 n=1 Tax=Megalopta genalis TaxID=115081 RepID=UPI003FD017DB